MSSQICLAGGGTGGHLVPNLALYKAFSSRNLQPYFYIPNNSFDQEFCRLKNVRCKSMSFGKLAKGSRLTVLLKVLVSLLEVGFHFLKERPAKVFGTGGYGAFPIYFWAVILRIPLFILEPNQVCGKVNRWFAPYAKLVFTAAGGVKGLEGVDNLVAAGNPLPYEDTVNLAGEPTLLVFGASQGASAINRFMASWLDSLGGPLSFRVIWITGRGEFEAYRGFADREGIDLYEFYGEMESLYRRSSLLLCRAGAGTISELKTFRVPAILIPYPHHADRQQYLNAEELVRSQACLLVEESELPSLGPGSMILELLLSPGRLERMKSNLPEMPRPAEIRKKIADRILQN